MPQEARVKDGEFLSHLNRRIHKLPHNNPLRVEFTTCILPRHNLRFRFPFRELGIPVRHFLEAVLIALVIFSVDFPLCPVDHSFRHKSMGFNMLLNNSAACLFGGGVARSHRIREFRKLQQLFHSEAPLGSKAILVC
jgi:hypothetical protein